MKIQKTCLIILCLLTVRSVGMPQSGGATFCMKETWKIVDGYPDYFISDLGRVKSLKYGKERIKKLINGTKGYLTVMFTQNKTIKTFRVHRLVLETFLYKSKLTVNHINGIKTDNRFVNLEYLTLQENIFHAHVLGLRKGLKPNQVIEIRKLLNSGVKTSLIRKQFDVTRHVVWSIRNNKRWNNLI